MKYLLIIILAVACIAGCSGNPPSLTDVYEGVWIDESIPLTLTIVHETGATFAYDLSGATGNLLTGSLYSYPDHAVGFSYDDGGQRQIVFTGFIDGDILSGKFTHTGLGFDGTPVTMVRYLGGP